MAERSEEKSSVLVFLSSLILLTSGILALPVGVVLLLVGEFKYGALFLAYGVVNAGIAMYGSNKSVLWAIFGIFLPWRKK